MVRVASRLDYESNLIIPGALHQYHTCLILLVEGYAAPEKYHLDRIWKCLDFVFELPPDLDRRSKARSILTEVAQKSEMYHNLRKVRAPKALTDRLQASESELEKQAMTQDTSPPAVAPIATPAMVQVSLNNAMPGGMPEFRNYTSTTSSDVYYATQQKFATQHVSPAHSSDTGSIVAGVDIGMRSDASSGDLMPDVDWVGES